MRNYVQQTVQHSTWYRCTRTPLVCLFFTCVLTIVSGCVQVPRNSQPIHAKETIPDKKFQVPQPHPKDSPEEIVRGFLKATAYTKNNFAVAQKFVHLPSGKQWKPQHTLVLIDQAIDVFINAQAHSDSHDATIRFIERGILDDRGTLKTSSIVNRASLTLSKNGKGEWRISHLPSDFPTLVDITQFSITHHPYNLYFSTHNSSNLAVDPRWIECHSLSTLVCLVKKIAAGPAYNLQNITEHNLSDIMVTDSSGVAYFSDSARHIELGRLTKADIATRKKVAAQIVWTLYDAGIKGSFILTTAGIPLLGNTHRIVSATDFTHYMSSQQLQVRLGPHALLNKKLFTVNNGALSLVKWDIPPVDLDSVAMSKNGKVAAVSGIMQGRVHLWVGEYGKSIFQVPGLPHARTISRPSWGNDNKTLWFVLDGRFLFCIQFVSAHSMKIDKILAATPDTFARGVFVSNVKISPDSSRIAFIYQGNPYMAVVDVHKNSLRLSEQYPLLTTREGQSTTLSWLSSTNVLVGRSLSENPIVNVNINGLHLATYPRNNLSTPIKSVNFLEGKIYVNDSRGLWVLNLMKDDVQWHQDPDFIFNSALTDPVVPVLQDQ